MVSEHNIRYEYNTPLTLRTAIAFAGHPKNRFLGPNTTFYSVGRPGMVTPFVGRLKIEFGRPHRVLPDREVRPRQHRSRDVQKSN